MECPVCENIELVKVDGVVEPATPMKDEVWGEWLECPNCGYETDLKQEEDNYEYE